MNWTNRKYRFAQITVWIQEGIFLLACFYYLYFFIHPLLMIEEQPAVFFKSADFLYDFLKIPGGCIDWLSAFCMQLWQSDLSSTIFLTFCFFLVAVLTRKWMEKISDVRPVHTFHLISVALLLLLHSQYDFRLNVTLALIMNLFFLVLFIHWRPEHSDIRDGLSLLVSVLLYWLTGGAFLIFAVLYGLGEILFRKQIMRNVMLLIISAALPYLASATVFLVPLKQAYMHNLSIEQAIQSWILAYSLPSVFLLSLLLVYLIKLPKIHAFLQNKAKKIKSFKFEYAFKVILGTVLLSGGTYLIAEKTYSDATRLVLENIRYTREGQWSSVLGLIKSTPYSNTLLASQMNLALYETNMLLENMFAYPQFLGTSGLLLDKQWCLAFPEEASDLFLKMGLVNEAQHWAHEAIEIKGATPSLLKQLGTIYMLKGDHETAGNYFRALKRIPFYEKTAEEMLECNSDSSKLALHNTYKQIISYIPSEDLISFGTLSSQELKLLLKQNPKNRMAFEYLIAYYLLKANVGGIWNHMSEFDALNYSKIPRHVQEALIVVTTTTPNFDLNKLRTWINPANMNRFNEYRKMLNNYQGDKNKAMRYLQMQFGDSYWFYLMFTRTVTQQSESSSEFQ